MRIGWEKALWMGLWLIWWLYRWIHDIGIMIVNLKSKENQIDKVRKLNKKPKQIYLSIFLNQKQSQETCLQKLLHVLEMIVQLGTNTIFIHCNGERELVQNLTKTFKKLGKMTKHIRIMQQSLTFPQKIDHVPLVIVMGSYSSVNGLPYEGLVNSEIGFCPTLNHCSSNDILNCFTQYALSTQRNGK